MLFALSALQSTRLGFHHQGGDCLKALLVEAEILLNGTSMAKIRIPDSLQSKIGLEVKMDVHLIDIKLKDGQVVPSLIVRGHRYITGRRTDPEGEGLLSFKSDDILDVRPHAMFGRLWPFWR